MGDRPTERVSARALRDLPGVLAVSVTGSSRCFREIHDAYVLCAVLSPATGESGGTIRYRRWSYDVAPGQILLMEPGELHVTQSVRGTANFRMLRIAPDALARLGGFEEAELHFRKPFVQDELLWRAICEAHACVTRGADDGAALMAVGAALQRAVAIGAEDARQASARLRPEIGRAAAILRARSEQRVLLGELASETGLTRYRLVQLFSQQLGLPPMQYLLQWRLCVARSRLARGGSISDAAHEAGFYDHAQFSRLFKRATGMTPRDYRRALSGS